MGLTAISAIRYKIINAAHYASPQPARFAAAGFLLGCAVSILLLIIIVILLFGGGGFYGYGRSPYLGGGIGLVGLIIILFLLFGYR